MNLLKICLAFTAVVLLCSCKKENTGVNTTNYSQLEVGNYWVYQRFDVDVSGNASPRNEYDSCYIEKDTLINNKTYYKMVRPAQPNMSYPEIYYLRDSLQYIVNHFGNIQFSSSDFTSTFSSFHYVQGNDTLYHVISAMGDKDMEVSTPYGSFVTSSLKITYNMFPAYSAGGSVRKINRRYAEGVGIVTETLYPSFSDPNYVERRLVRYKVE